MGYTEELTWILDKINTNRHSKDEEYKENIAFVHSLGKKCDCVGWSTLKRDDPRAEEILEKIAAFCENNGWIARGLYTRTYTDPDPEWYEIKIEYFKADTAGACIDVPAQDGGTCRISSIKAYRELIAAPKGWVSSLCVPERFRDAYIRAGLTGLDFCWMKDIGKYAAEQYFEVFATHLVPRVAVAWDLKNRDLRKLGPDCGWLPRLGQLFRRWTQINLPYCYMKSDMPAGGIAYAHIPYSFSCCGLYKVLVHKDIAAQLLQKKALPVSALNPVPIVETLPEEYTLRDTTHCPRPTAEYMAQSILDYEHMKAMPRPAWNVSEKDALKTMRKAKAERKEDFGKKLSKEKAAAIANTDFAPVLPYYLVANGGYMSEYQFLSVDEAQAETVEFYQQLEKEELLEDKPEGIVICHCADGDQILLLRDGPVIRFSHEVPEATNQWPSLAHFIVNIANECRI